MVDVAAIKRNMQITRNENGESMVTIPLAVWEELLAEVESSINIQRKQVENFEAFLKETENYQDDKSSEWWNEFDKFLRDNRLHFPERDLGLGNE